MTTKFDLPLKISPGCFSSNVTKRVSVRNA